jgi:hypothetical protein
VSEWEKTLQFIGVFGLGLVCIFSFEQMLQLNIASLKEYGSYI